MQQQFLSFINVQQLFGQTDYILLTVSGGIDSVVLADQFRKAGYRYGIAHVNFQLRGDESDADEAFVRELAQQHGVAFHFIRFDTRQQTEAAGQSTQMVARQLRYAWFEQVADAFGYTRIATAHHQDDVLETLLLNLVRGTGLAGLHGIPVRQGRLVRPLWFADRAQIEQYAAANQLTWREDRSNASDYYRRNRIRHQVVPVLKELNPNLTQTLQTTVARLRAAEALARLELDRSWERLAEVRPDGVYVAIEPLTTEPEWAFRLAEWLRPFGFPYTQVEPIARSVGGTAFGQTFSSATHRIVRDRAFLVIQPVLLQAVEEVRLDEVPAEAVSCGNGFRLWFERIERTVDFRIPAAATVACLDADRLRWPLLLRPWREGDRFRPLGLNGSQSVGDFLTNRKVTLLERQAVWVLQSGGEIAWVVGYRPDDRFRITAQTQRILRIDLQQEVGF